MTEPLTGRGADEPLGGTMPAGDPHLHRVLEVVRAFALECGGPRAMQAVEPNASLVADVGLGSLEQVELGSRLEEAFGVQLGDEAVGMDTPAELARAVREARDAETLPRSLEPEPVPGMLPDAGFDHAHRAATLHEALLGWMEVEALRPHVYLQGDDGSSTTLTYGQLWEGAASVAGGLGEHGVERQETVAVMLPTGADFLRTFMGILVAGAIPVPLYPPARMARIEDYLRRQAGILDNAGARLLVTVPGVKPVARVLRGSLGPSLGITTPEELARAGQPVESASGSSRDPALIQYTSGSTGAPKGVLLTHEALLANIRAIAGHLEMSPADVAVSWLPLYHDMGLIGTWLSCLYQGVPLALMSPLAFLGRPDRWLWTIHRYRGTLSAAPNFGYELCIGKIPGDRLEGLDLSSWRCALNGSEPVSSDTVERFSRRFEPFGFRSEAMIPAYGLAESAVALCLSPLGRGPLVDRVSRGPFEKEGRARPPQPAEASPLRFVSMGPPLPGHEVQAVDDLCNRLPEGRIGRLFFRGPSSMEGYYRRPEATEDVSRAGGWIDTGDLGYVKESELYVTGRSKDLIIKAGRNLVPEEIEALVGSLDGIRKGCVAAFGVTDPRAGTERLVIVAETRITEPEERSALESAVIRSVSEAIDLPPDRVVLLSPRSVPKTSSGKIRRGTAREWFQAGRLGARERVSLRMRIELLRGRITALTGASWALIRRAAYIAYLVVATPAALVLVALPAWGLASVLPGRRPALVLERLVSRIALWIVGIRISVEGVENLPDRGPAILAANHSSYLDTPALLGHLPLDIRIVAKKEVLGWPLVGTFVRRADHPTVERREFRESVRHSRAMERHLAAGEAVLFFPEGTFVRAKGLRPFRLGVFELAVKTETSVIPVAIVGTRHALPSGKALPRPGRVAVRVGPAIAPDGRGWPAVLGLRDRVFEAIADRCGEPRIDVIAGGPVARPR